MYQPVPISTGTYGSSCGALMIWSRSAASAEPLIRAAKAIEVRILNVRRMGELPSITRGTSNKAPDALDY